jgi:hypothetical protein
MIRTGKYSTLVSRSAPERMAGHDTVSSEHPRFRCRSIVPVDRSAHTA